MFFVSCVFRLAVGATSVTEIDRVANDVVWPHEHGSLTHPIMRSRFALMTGWAVLSTAATASAADHPRVRLVYEAERGATACPDADAIREAVGTQLGYDPFHDDGQRAVRVRLRRRATGMAADVEMIEGGRSLGVRHLESPSSDCAELTRTLALTIGIGIDPVRAFGARASQAGPSVTPESAAVPPGAVAGDEPMRSRVEPARDGHERAADAPAEGDPTRARAHATAAVLGAIGAEPAPSFGGSIGARLVWPIASVGMEARADLPASVDIPQGRVTAWRWTIAALVCGLREPLFACALGSAGAVQGSGAGVDAPRNDATAFLSAGLRAGVDLPITAAIALAPYFEVEAPLLRTALVLDGVTAWRTPPVAGSLGITVAARIP